jgi:FkbM family methyltransferase
MSFLKSIIAGGLTQLTQALPRGARRAVADGLGVGPDRFALLSQLAQAVGVDGLLVPGAYGLIQSSSRDQAILKIYAQHGRFAARTNDLLLEFFASSGPASYVDVGANIGLTTIPVAQLAHVSCLAIEPEPTNYRHLVANIARNCPHDNVKTRQYAVYGEASTLQFEVSPDNLGDHRLRLTEADGEMREHLRAVIAVPAETLDTLTADVPDSPMAVKIDVQGAEPFVCAGGQRTLARADLLILEFWPYGMARLGGDIAIVLDALSSHFGTLALAHGETASPDVPQPSRAVTSELRDYVAQYRKDPHTYLDVIARK